MGHRRKRQDSFIHTRISDSRKVQDSHVSCGKHRNRIHRNRLDSLKKKARFAPFTEAKRQDNWKIMKVTAAEKADIYRK
jgi:hypothetical protein